MLMAFLEELWVLDLDKEIGNGGAVETITNLWGNATSWIEAYGGSIYRVVAADLRRLSNLGRQASTNKAAGPAQICGKFIKKHAAEE